MSGEILLNDLLLERLRGCRDNYLAPRQDRGNQICERLTCSCAGFRDQGSALGKGALYSRSHLELAGALFVAWQSPREQTTWTQKGAGRRAHTLSP